MKKLYTFPFYTLLIGLFFLCENSYSQRYIFDPINPAQKFWDGETYYTESNKIRIDFRLMDKKLPEVTIQNAATKEEVQVKSGNYMYAADMQLVDGANDIFIWASKQKSKFHKQIKVFYNPHTTPATTALDPQNCDIQLVGNYNLSPQIGSVDIIIKRSSQFAFETRFLVNCCEDKNLKVSVENPHNQEVELEHKGNNTFAFQTQLFDYENIYTLRASCKSKEVAQRRLVIRVDEEFNSRLDTAILFAVTKHKRRARKLGWSDLKYAENDVLALKWTLENKFGFGVRIIYDPTWEDIHDTMEALKEKKWDNLDQLFVFFSGHGHVADGRGYLIPSNAEESVKTYYKMEDLREQIDEIPCNNISLNIDACFASTFLERGGKDIPYRRGSDLHELLSADLPFRYFIGSSPANKEVAETGIFIKDVKAANGKYKYHKKKFKVSEFMNSYLEAIEEGEKELNGSPVPIWYVGRKVEELYRPKKLINGQNVYARATRFGSQNDKGFHFIPQMPRTK